MEHYSQPPNTHTHTHTHTPTGGQGRVGYHGEHLGELRGGAGEHGGHDEVEQRHELQQVVLQRRARQQQAMLSLRGTAGRDTRLHSRFTNIYLTVLRGISVRMSGCATIFSANRSSD